MNGPTPDDLQSSSSPPSYISTMMESPDEILKLNQSAVHSHNSNNPLTNGSKEVKVERSERRRNSAKSPINPKAKQRERIGSASDVLLGTREFCTDFEERNLSSLTNPHLLTVPSAPNLIGLSSTLSHINNGNSQSILKNFPIKEPRDLYAITRDFNLNKCLPRWPVECQVLGKKIRHIRSVPSMSEVFYEVTGKEPQPRPLGEEHGVVVFDYQPSSSVSYFSRSVAAPTPDSPTEFQSDLPVLPDTLRFESRFESANLAKVVRITEAYYELQLRSDLYTPRHCQWFYFQVTNMRTDLTYRFSIVNLSKPDSLYTCGMKPVLYSEIEAEKHFVGWSRVGSNIRYYRNENYDEEEGFTYTLTFSINFPHDNDTVYLAHCYPYTYSDLQEDLNAIQENESRAQYCSQRLLCRSLAGNNVYVLTITSPGTQEDLKRKHMVVFSSRVHSGETPSSWIMRGILHFLTGDSEVAAELRDRFIFKIVPMLNPDGVIVGNTRCSLAGRDLNRQYKLMEESGVVFYCDFHAHSRRFNVFMYGCENRRHSDKFLKEQVFPLMLHKNTSEKFSFDDCRFRIQRQKESTGRVVFWNMGITCSYTLEASYGGTNMGTRAFTHFNTDDYEGIGRYFCETLLDYNDPCPVKEQLRNKILTRLLKEGSTADEPANIALSDYSSLSSADISSSDEISNPGSVDNSTSSDGKKKIRKLRSRRERSRNGAQFTKSTYFPGNELQKFPVASMIKKSDSDRALNKKKKGDRRKFKRSSTMANIPAEVLAQAAMKRRDGACLSPRVQALRRSESKKANFTIGTSDESEEDTADDEDLQKLFCPLTDTNGSPYDVSGDSLSDSNMGSLSASSCRQVHSEILESVSRIKCSLLGRKGGLLHSYTTASLLNLSKEVITQEIEDSSDGESCRSLTPLKINTNGLSSASGKKKNPTISVNIPTSASTSQMYSEGTKVKSIGKKKWEKYGNIRKACKVSKKETSVNIDKEQQAPQQQPPSSTPRVPKSFTAVAKMELAKQKKKKKKAKAAASKK